MRDWLPMAVLTCLLSSVSHAQLTMGVLGDSISDEYLGAGTTLFDGRTDLAAYSWTQILAQTRPDQLGFGQFEADPLVRGEPRYEGYEHVWARSGATATTPGIMGTIGFGEDYTPLAGQTQGLLPAVQDRTVDTVFLGIGANDFLVRHGIEGVIPPSPLSGPDHDAWEDRFIDQVFESVDLLTAAGNPTILLALVPGIAGGSARPELDAALANANARLQAGAEGREGVEIVDLYGWRTDAGRVDEQGRIKVGELWVEPGSAPLDSLVPAGTPGAGACNSRGLCASAEHAGYQFAEDDTHPNTVMQALAANEILEVLNRALDVDIALLSDAEILGLTGYATAEVPLPAAGWLLLTALAGLVARARRV